MNLIAERQYVLGCLAGTPHHAFVHDAALSATVRQVVGRLESEDDQVRVDQVAKCNELYDKYGPGIWKSIIEYSYLLHTASEAAQVFSGVLRRLENDLRDDPQLANQLVNELGWYESAPYDYTVALVRLTLERLAKATPQALSALITNREVGSSLRVGAVEVLCNARCVSAYGSVLSYLTEASTKATEELYWRVIARIMDAYVQTGATGLHVAVEAFEHDQLGKQGPRLLAGFRSEFAEWFLSRSPKPSPRWARVLVNGWHLSDSADHRNTLLSLLLDEWCTDPAIAEIVRQKLQQQLRRNRFFLAPANRQLRAKALQFAHLGHEERGKDLEQSLRRAANGTSEDWNRWCSQALVDRATGHVAGAVFVDGGLESKQRILNWVEGTSKRDRFQQGFFQAVLKSQRFLSLHTDAQERIFRSRHFVRNVRSSQIEKLLETKDRLSPDVVRGLTTALASVLRSAS
jgi:hypothetical protein